MVSVPCSVHSVAYLPALHIFIFIGGNPQQFLLSEAQHASIYKQEKDPAISSTRFTRAKYIVTFLPTKYTFKALRFL